VHGVFGEKEGYGAGRSCHKLRLAIDLNLFRNGRYLERSEDHRRLGEWWESQGAHGEGVSATATITAWSMMEQND
jgi:hypothetical protein